MSALGSDPPQSACVIFLGVLDIQSAAGLLQCVVAVVVVGREGGGGLCQRSALIYVSTCA